MPDDWTDERLEQAFRDGLRRHAADAPTELRDGIPSNAGPSPRLPGRRRTIWLAAAAAAAVAVGVPIALQRGDGLGVATTPSPTSAASTPPPTSRATPSAGPGPGWRTESYAGVELSVPDDWGWGGTPVNPGAGDPGVCEVRGATVSPDGTRDPNARMRLPFVGRPVLQSDACSAVAPADARPDVDAVWFGSPLPVGRTSGARPSRTMSVGGQRVSVFTADADLADRVLGSAHAVSIDANGCPTGEPTDGEVAQTGPSTLVVCAYRGDRLMFGVTRGADAAAAWLAALGAGQDATPVPCPTEPVAERVWVRVAGAKATFWQQIDLGACNRVFLSGRVLALTPALITPWSGPESKVYLVGPDPGAGELDPRMYESFRGVLG